MNQKTINIHKKKEPHINPMQAVWWKPLFSMQKEVTRVCRNACSGFAPVNKFWEMQDEMLEKAQTQMHRLFGDIFNQRQMALPWLMGDNTEPYLDLTEKEGIFRIRAELPGVDEGDLKIFTTEGGLVIQGKKSLVSDETDEKTLRRECHYGSFTRTIALPDEADVENAFATFRKSILNIEVPKKPDGKAARFL
jgi:HSP20 family protein